MLKHDDARHMIGRRVEFRENPWAQESRHGVIVGWDFGRVHVLFDGDDEPEQVDSRDLR